MITHAKSIKLSRMPSPMKNRITSEPIVVIVAVTMAMNAFLFPRWIIWSDMIMALSIISVSDIVNPAKENICNSIFSK